MKGQRTSLVLFICSSILAIISNGSANASGIENHAIIFQHSFDIIEYTINVLITFSVIFSKDYFNKREKYAVHVTTWKHLTAENVLKVLFVLKTKELILCLIFLQDVDLKLRQSSTLIRTKAENIMEVIIIKTIA